MSQPCYNLIPKTFTVRSFILQFRHNLKLVYLFEMNFASNCLQHEDQPQVTVVLISLNHESYWKVDPCFLEYHPSLLMNHLNIFISKQYYFRGMYDSVPREPFCFRAQCQEIPGNFCLIRISFLGTNICQIYDIYCLICLEEVLESPDISFWGAKQFIFKLIFRKILL